MMENLPEMMCTKITFCFSATTGLKQKCSQHCKHLKHEYIYYMYFSKLMWILEHQEERRHLFFYISEKIKIKSLYLAFFNLRILFSLQAYRHCEAIKCLLIAFISPVLLQLGGSCCPYLCDLPSHSGRLSFLELSPGPDLSTGGCICFVQTA